jgi:hypothetical protein
MQNRYHHTQRAHTILVIFSIAAVIATIVALAAEISFWPVGGALLFLALILWMFSSMTIQVDLEAIRWHFGPGLFRWRRPLNTIQEASRDRSHWIYGWGIRLTPHGWLYNVSGLDIVTIHLTNGKRFALGTDDPDGLLAAIQGNMEKPS